MKELAKQPLGKAKTPTNNPKSPSKVDHQGSEDCSEEFGQMDEVHNSGGQE